MRDIRTRIAALETRADPANEIVDIAAIIREGRDEAISAGPYRPLTPEELDQGEAEAREAARLMRERLAAWRSGR